MSPNGFVLRLPGQWHWSAAPAPPAGERGRVRPARKRPAARCPQRLQDQREVPAELLRYLGRDPQWGEGRARLI